MLKFIPGILLLQAITIALVLIGPADPASWDWVRLAVPVLIAAILTAFWFGSIAARLHKDEISRLKDDYAKEREAIRVNAERAKTRLVTQTQRKTLQEVRRSSRGANIKIGLAFAGAAGLGVLLVLTQFMSLGLLTLAFVAGATGGYVLRIRQEKGKPQLPPSGREPARMINAASGKTKESPPADPP